ncbi:T9SS type B sorting domain-containing protein [Flavobacterium sp.]|uniref:T9SS type B sorting domain-containing protein n=1 Tax=Flavobacterium sp. TaxID=239 RepID=UPI001226201D|nr:T9SS type B sorting domain-containing protein [Flavobacterium sp.]RZJ69252.1 MAG: T9SS type B sorting domain-containing protein [Flavobacterium sp.]
MNLTKSLFALLLFSLSTNAFSQLGFCPGSKGEPIFFENFGNGTTYGPALPTGTTTYPFVTGAPNDGQYTLFYHSSMYTTWHYSLDHTPDVTNGPNGKMLLMNANATTSGDFYRKVVTGLCINTTFEFSAWLMNVYNPNTNYCGAGQIPINVRFEIWNATETVLLGSGNTGNIMGTPAPIWQQFALVFTTASETSVVLKMKNNGLGGCGNDLAIDDISFSACGDLTTVSSPSVVGSAYSTCSNPASLQLNASTASAIPYFYQWQSSLDNTIWTDIPGATNATYTTPNLTSQTFYRVRAAQDAANLSSSFCASVSNVFTISFLPTPTAATSDGDQTICSGDAIPTLSVTANAGANVNWYSAASGGTLLQSNSATYTPTAAGTFYAETYDSTSNCIASPRTPVSLTIVTLPDVTISGNASICSGNSATINFTGTPNAVVTYTVNSGPNQTITLNASGIASITASALTANTIYTLVSVATANSSTCIRTKNDFVTITVNPVATASISSVSSVCAGGAVTINFSGTANATVTYNVNSGANQTIVLTSSGNAAITIPSFTADATYNLVSVSLAGSCPQTLSQAITITAVPMPTASISATPATICSNQTSTIAFTGTPNAVVTYTLNAGANQTITLNASGSATLTTAANLNSNQTYQLVSIVSPVLNSCVTTLSASATVTVNQVATASISSVSAVCSGSSATVNFVGTANAVVTYSVNSGANQNITLNASGNASISIPNITSATTVNLVQATLNGVCAQSLSQSITINSVPMPTASINANPLTICANQNSTINFVGTPNAVITYKVGSGANQTIALNASGTASFTTSGLTSNTTYSLVSVASPTLTTCVTNLNGAVTVAVNSLPTASVSVLSPVCYGSAATVNFTGTANATITYTINAGANQTVALNATGNASVVVPNVTSALIFTLTNVVSAGANPCSNALSQSVTVSTYPMLQAAISANPTAICSGQTSTVSFVGTPNSVVTYTVNGGSNQTINLNASGSASLVTSGLSANATYQLVDVALAGTSCNLAVSGSASITITPTPIATFTGNLSYCDGDSVAINLSSTVAGTIFSWTASQNGTSGANSGTGNTITDTLTLTGTSVGTATYTVIPVYNGCAGSPVNIVVTVNPLPIPAIADGVICTTSAAPPASQFYTLDTNLSAATHTFQWFFGSNPIPGAFGSTYNATQIGTYSVIATNSAGCVSNLVSANVSEMSQGESLVLQQSAAFSDNPSVTVTVVGGTGPFLYQLDNQNFQSSNTFNDIPAGTHTITVIDETCTNLTTTFSIIDYPKYFTPNGDGYNDTWNIKGLSSDVFIYDRYGKLVKQISTNGTGWDGTYNGSQLPSTDYWFTIDYSELGKTKTFRAHFTLKR